MTGPDDVWLAGNTFEFNYEVDGHHHAWCRSTFAVPKEFWGSDRRIALSFESVHHRADVYVNGHLVGQHEIRAGNNNMRRLTGVVAG